MNAGSAVRRGAAISTLLVALVAMLVPAPAGAVITNQWLTGTAAATRITGTNGLIDSGPTSASYLSTSLTGKSASNSLADATVAGLAHVDGLTTRVSTTAITGGKRLNSSARVANLNLLGGVVKATAVETLATVSIVNGIATPTSNTQFTDLVVAGQAIPIYVRRNTTISVPGVATVILNASSVGNTSDATAVAAGAGIRITLLSAIGSSPAGTTINVTPTWAAASTPGEATGTGIGGSGYATKVTATVGGLVKALSGPTARMSMPPGGTAGKDVTNSTLAVNVPKLLSTGVVTNTANGSVAPEASRSTITSKVTGLNLLNGLVKADVITGTATASKPAGGAVQLTPAATYVNLVLGGKPMPVSVPANTVIDVPGLGRVTLNQQVRTATGMTIRAINIKIGTEGLGLPVGATVELGVANAWVGQAG